MKSQSNLYTAALKFTKLFFLRGSGALPAGVQLASLAHLQEGVPSAGGVEPDVGLRLGLHAAERTDAPRSGARAAPSASKYVTQHSVIQTNASCVVSVTD